MWPNSEIKISKYPTLSLIKGNGRPSKLHRRSGHGVLEHVFGGPTHFPRNQFLLQAGVFLVCSPDYYWLLPSDLHHHNMLLKSLLLFPYIKPLWVKLVPDIVFNSQSCCFRNRLDGRLTNIHSGGNKTLFWNFATVQDGCSTSYIP